MTEARHGHVDNDLWSWINDQDPGADTPAINPEDVTAVMVVHNAAEWLPRQLLSLAGLQPRPGRIIAVDAASADGSRDLLARAHSEGVVHDLIEVEDGAAFGAAVARGLADRQPEWIWLLHDDSSPHRDALARLLDGARQADVVVPKLLEPKRRNYPETLSEVGQAITMSGARVPQVEEGDIDQQQIEPTEVMGASTAGLLVRGSLWRELDGLASEIGRHRDGVDFGWRANAHGYRVLTWPAAALNHLRAGRTGQRDSSRHPHHDDRLAALRVVGARGASKAGLVAASLARSVGFLLAKSPSFAAAELRALREFQATPDATERLRARLPEEDLTPHNLVPGRGWPLRHALDRAGSSVTWWYRDLTESDPDVSIDELTGDEYAGGGFRRRMVSPATVLFVMFALAAVIAGVSLLGSGLTAGGGLLPAPSSLPAAWEAYLTAEAPWVGFGALLALLGLGDPGWVTTLVVLAVPVLAAAAAAALLHRLAVPKPAAAALSGAWAAAVLVLGVVTAGDVSGMVLAVAGPLLARSVWDFAKDDATGVDRLRAPAATAFWLIVVAVVWPAALLLATVCAILWAVRDRSRTVVVAVATLPAWAFLSPWLPTLARYPGRLLTGADPLAWQQGAPPSYALLIGRILPSGFPLWLNVVFFAALAAAAIWAVASLPRRIWVWSLVVIAVPLLAGSIASRLLLAVEGGFARALLSPWALLVVATLLAPLAWHAARGKGLGRVPLIALGLAALLAAGTWAWFGFAGPVQPAERVLPGYVRDVLHSPRDTRALLISRSDDASVTWNVVDARQPQWGSGERHPSGGFAEQFEALAAAIAVGAAPDDLAERLRMMGVSHLWLGGFDGEQRAAVDNLAGLVGAAADDDSVVWTVSGLVSRSYVATTDGREPVVAGTVPAGDGDRRLELAEPTGSDWTVHVDGDQLEPIRATESDGGVDIAQFDLGARSGEFVAEPGRHGWRFAVHLLVLLLLGLLAAPSYGSPATTARRGQP